MLTTGVGFMSGVVLGASLTAFDVLISKLRSRPGFGLMDAAVEGVIITTIGGAILGITWPNDTWRHVPLEGDPPRLTIRPLRDGRMGFGLSFGD
jgi:multisubunit Na+/H+ antiporter MnhB subunit